MQSIIATFAAVWRIASPYFRIEEEAHWNRMRSLGKQRRLAFTRDGERYAVNEERLTPG